jgi:Predicted membrane protein
MKKAVFGLLVIAAGFIWLGSNMGLIDNTTLHIIFSWPMLLVAIGLTNLAERDSRFTGIVLILIGSFFLAPRLISTPYNFIGIYWPVLIIILGVMIFFSALTKRFWINKHFHHYSEEITDGDLDEMNIFGGSKKKITDQNFRGGKITNIFGGAEIDLTKANLVSGRSVLDVTCIFGGVSIIVPSDWSVQVSVVSILGGFHDKRSTSRNEENPNKILIIKGSAVFGGGEIKSY